jgi:ABC-type nitrate/sulfonate/bicarbonate transport system substrate-binding protein
MMASIFSWRHNPALASLALAALLGVACAPQAPAAAPAKPVEMFTFKYVHGFRIQANPVTAAVVIARDQGFYQAENLTSEEEIVTTVDSYRLIATGQFYAGTAAPSVVLDFNNQGLPLEAIAVINHEGSRAFAVKADSGKKVGVKGSPWYDYLCILQANGVDRAKIQEIGVGFSSVELKDGIVDVLPVFKSNEPLILKNMGVDTKLLTPEQNGCPTWGSTFVVSKQFAKDHPDELTRWLRATLKGLYFYSENKGKALDILAKYAPKEATPELEEFLYSVEQPQLSNDLTRKNGLGWMTPEMWQGEIDRQIKVGMVKGPIKVDDVMTMEFLQKVYKDGKLI